MKNKSGLLVIAALLSAALCGCGADSGSGDGATGIILSDEGCMVQGRGAEIHEGTVSIYSGGSYRISGSLSEGQILVNAGDSADDVIIILDGVSISSSSGPAVYIQQARNTRIRLPEGSSNIIVSGTEGGAVPEDAAGAAVYAEDDLDIEGKGQLEIRGFINNGIGCKDDLDINDGMINVYAVNNGIKASESLEIKGGEIHIESGNDGLKTTSDKKEGKGFVRLSGGRVDIVSRGDGISALTELYIEDGSLNISTQGDPVQVSSKGLKAGKGLCISGGETVLSSSDHAVQCDAGIDISGGELSAVSAAERGISAKGSINISGGRISLEAADDGMKAVEGINMSGGSVRIISGENGMQAGDRTSAGDRTVTADGGELYISAYRQGINADSFRLSGGTVFILQNDGYISCPCSTGQASLSGKFSAAKGQTVTAADTEIESGNACRMIYFSSPEIEPGTEYTVSDGIMLTKFRAG